ncbi:MAG: TonB-dependent receptor [Xanthomonadales bacterium]|nr:TonB-dependent receptor [Xanthomonadales bacterium]
MLTGQKKQGGQAVLKHLFLGVAIALGTVALMPATALAQEESTEIRDSVLEEVIVTATRREESLMEVPIAVTAISGEELAKFGMLDITFVEQMSPNTTLKVSRGTNTTLTAFIRGVGQQDPVPGFESGIGIYLDDVYLNRPQAGVMDIYDVERIEVLRGPQGTLYGRNTIGGAIKYVTKRLNADNYEGNAKFSYGTDNLVNLNLTGSAPISDTFRVGASIASFNRDGFGDNLYLTNLENYNKDVLGVRASAEWEPNEDFFLRFAFDYVDDDSDPRQGHREVLPNVSDNGILGNVFDTEAGLNNPKQSVKSYGYSLLAQWNASDLITLKNILAYRDDKTWTPIDFDSLPVADLDVPAFYKNDQFSEELQVLFSADRWNGIAGFYYLDANASTGFDVILGQLGDLLGLPGFNAFTAGDVNTKTWSLFGDFTFEVNDQFSVSLGGRYTSDKRTSTVLRQSKLGGTSPIFGGNAIPFATTSDFNGSETFTKFTPRISLDLTPNDDNLFYVSYSEGFKGGSFDPRGQTSLAPDLDGDGVVSDEEVFEFMKFDPETVKTLEFGWKATALQGRMTSKLAVFFSTYTDVQVPGSIGYDSTGDGLNDTFVGITSNAGKADINGVEWEGQAILANDLISSGSELRFGWAVGYINARYKKFIDAFGVDVANERVFQNTPKWTISGNLNYSAPVNWFNTAATFSALTSLTYRGATSQFEVPNPFLDQPSYTLWDLSLVWAQDQGNWSFGVHGKNLINNEYKVAGYFFPALGLENNITAFYGNPRQIWGTVQYNWF